MKISQITTSRIVVAVLIAAVVLSSCSTTRRIPDDEILYTGVGKIAISMPSDSTKLNPEISSQIKTAVDVPPNNYLSLIGWHYPFPLGLWVYNNWDNPPKGFKHWLYEKLVEEPVLVSDVRPEVRTHMIEQILDNNGYFRGSATYELEQNKDPKKAKIRYSVNPGPAYTIDTIFMLPDTTRLGFLVDSLALRDPYLSSKSPVYSTDSLSVARTRITNSLRNRGYYFFRPEYIEYLADSVVRPRHITLKMMLASNALPFALKPYTTGKITIYASRSHGAGVPDTVDLQRATLIQMMPSKLRHSSIAECISFRPGRTFSVRNMDRTQTNLARLGIFSAINIEAVPDTLDRESQKLNVDIHCTFDTPLETSLEVNAASKSNSYIGPGLTFGITNKNIFGGGEQLSLKLTGAYEWQTGSGRRSVFNSYEVGLSGSLAFPRLLAPKFIPRSRFQLNWTRFQLNADLLNRPHYFKMAQFNASVNYDWRFRRYVQNTLTLFKLTYTNLMKTTAEFDSIMVANQAVAQSFKSQYIPQMAYTYVYDKQLNRNNTINWQFTLQEAGNIFWGIYRAFGKTGEKELFGTPFSQFVKGQAQLVWGRRVGHGDHWLVSRVAAGAAHAYGNSSQVPYPEQFYVGGANSVRAFTVRSIGPGRYKAAPGQTEDYFDRTGTLKFEANVEYRFPLFGPIRGAAFVDAGNVWLIQSDPMRPGGTINGKYFLRDLALGTGLGIRLDISMLVVRGDLGIGIHTPYDTGRRGYYNMPSFGKSLAFHLAIGYPF
ncbi:MAG: BamA/TamA family outer membrane protein [Muribaculaceae bacterium]|nr:BamA/TamA family outer membrane protein [Muribaculaceae bacterium]